MMVPQNNDMSNMYYVSFMNNETGTICMQPMILQDGQFIPVVIVCSLQSPSLLCIVLESNGPAHDAANSRI